MSPTHLSDSNSLVERAELLLGDGDPRSALASLNSALAGAPGSLKALFVRAKIHADLRRFADALADLENVLLQAPGHLKARKLKAEIYLLLNQHEAALLELTELVQHSPQDLEAVRALERLEDFLSDESTDQERVVGASVDHRLAGFQEAVAGTVAPSLRADEQEHTGGEQDDEPTFATKTIAELYLRQGHRAKAVKVLNMLLAENPGDPWARTTLAQLAGETQLPPSGNSVKTPLTIKARKIRVLERMLGRIQARERLDSKYVV